jgi:hypothetical protein
MSIMLPADERPVDTHQRRAALLAQYIRRGFAFERPPDPKMLSRHRETRQRAYQDAIYKRAKR